MCAHPRKKSVWVTTTEVNPFYRMDCTFKTSALLHTYFTIAINIKFLSVKIAPSLLQKFFYKDKAFAHKRKSGSTTTAWCVPFFAMCVLLNICTNIYPCHFFPTSGVSSLRRQTYLNIAICNTMSLSENVVCTLLAPNITTQGKRRIKKATSWHAVMCTRTSFQYSFFLPLLFSRFQ